MNREDKPQESLCENCGLLDRPFVPWYIPEHWGFETILPVLWVAQAPGRVEATETFQPLTGPAGKQHYACMREAGLNKLQFPATNTCSCWPPAGLKGRDRPPSPSEMECCFPRLKAEIQTIKPILIVALGNIAVKALTGNDGKITGLRGHFLPLLSKYEHECEVLACLHPEFVRTVRQWIPTQVKDYMSIFPYLKGEVKEVLEPVFLLDPTEEELRDYLSKDVIYTVDTESTGLDKMNDKILGHSISRGDDTAAATYYVGVKPQEDPRFQVMKEYLENPKAFKSWQNGPFDKAIGRVHGIKDQGYIYDTRLAQQIIHSDMPSDLDYLRGQYTNIDPYKPTKSEMKRIKHWDKEKMLTYACWDAITTYKVMEAQKKLLTKEQLNLLENHLIPLSEAIVNMEIRGFRVNINTIAALMSQCLPVITEINKIFSDKGINPRSPKQLINYWGLKSSDEEHLEAAIKRNHPDKEMMELLLYQYRPAYNMYSKYLNGIYERLINERIHTTFKPDGTGTGRLSSENPNLQNIPEEMRVIYIPDPDHLLLVGDYSQIELWVGAILIYIITGDEMMLRDLESGLDLHYEACKLCFPHIPLIHGIRKRDFTHQQELIAKTVNFGTFYMRGARSVAMEFGVTVAEAERWQHALIQKYPGRKGYIDWVLNEVASKGYVETPFHRRRYVTSAPQGANFPVQSTAGDVTLGSIWRIDQAGIPLLASVHDNCVQQIPKDTFYEGYHKVKSIMERKIPELLNLSFKVDYTLGLNWYDQISVEASRESKEELGIGGSD